jgi:hypothetical protein
MGGDTRAHGSGAEDANFADEELGFRGLPGGAGGDGWFEDGCCGHAEISLLLGR